MKLCEWLFKTIEKYKTIDKDVGYTVYTCKKGEVKTFEVVKKKDKFYKKILC